MEPLKMKPRPQMQEEIECWDDDDDLQGDAFQFRTASSATTTTTASVQAFQATGSSSSRRMSEQTDLEANLGGDEDQQFHIPGDDEASMNVAINSAISAGIPIPKNVPSSALVGGTIKRLGGKRSKKVLGDDWSEDLVLPNMDGRLTIKKKDATAFPDTFRQYSDEFSKLQAHTATSSSPSFAERIKSFQPMTASSALDKFRDNDGDDFFCDGDAVPIIKLAKSRSPRKSFTFPSPVLADPPADAGNDFEQDLELPENGEPLRLSTRKEMPRTPNSAQSDFDEWAEGSSLGTRYGGTKRDGRSNRSSSFSAMSPSVSSSFTVESEDEGLDGLVLPAGPLNLGKVLKKRQQTTSPDMAAFTVDKEEGKRVSARDDFFSGLEIGDGDVFDSGKLTLNRNIKHKSVKAVSPTRRTAMTLTFTNTAPTPQTRIPKLKSGHDRGSSGSTLEPVSESGSALQRSRRAPSRLSGHSAQSSISSIPTPSTPSRATVPTPSTPIRQRNLGTRPSMKALRPEPTTTNAQLLKMKRSMPILNPSPGKTNIPFSHYQHRPPSRGDGLYRQPFTSRPKSPTERSESALGNRKAMNIVPPVPFLPAGGSSSSRSHHISSKNSRNSRRHESELSMENVLARPSSRASRATMRSPSPRHTRAPLLAPESLAREAAGKRTLTRPKRGRNFGDGNELEVFDDLPTSAANESKFVKVPVGRGAPKTIRSKLGPHSLQPPSVDPRSETPTPSPAIRSALRPLCHSQYPTPRFARDTNASRIAREARTLHPPSVTVPPVSLSCSSATARSTSSLTSARHPLISSIAATTPTASSSLHPRPHRRRPHQPPSQQKPHLIKPLNDTHLNPKSLRGMAYNPSLYRWEGNENALVPFDHPIYPPDNIQPAQRNLHSALTGIPPTREPKTVAMNSTPATFTASAPLPTTASTQQRPALITNVGSISSPTIKVVGGMVFDPIKMCWLKLRRNPGLRPHGPRLPQPTSRPGSSSASLDTSESHAFADGKVREDDAASELADLEDDNDSDDPFRGIDDLDDARTESTRPSFGTTEATGKGGAGSAEKTADEWLVGEEFDVGPEFVRRQREEEERWRRKVEGWIGGLVVVARARGRDGHRDHDHAGAVESRAMGACDDGPIEREDDQWRWAIRDVLSGGT